MLRMVFSPLDALSAKLNLPSCKSYSFDTMAPPSMWCILIFLQNSQSVNMPYFVNVIYLHFQYNRWHNKYLLVECNMSLENVVLLLNFHFHFPYIPILILHSYTLSVKFIFVENGLIIEQCPCFGE